ncbi:DNA polymerase III, partial [Streptomyces sp. MBT49]|uniref:exonuclease domain-containing protein n=1 Tax=Streptomyces sp. MBT49 TaxID=1488380 RepID=UPI00190B9E69
MSRVSPLLDEPAMGDYAYDWALVDVETSGLVARRDRVLSVAVITIDPDGEQTGEFSTLLNPGCDPGPVEVHGLTRERLQGAPTFAHVAGRIAAMLQDRVLVAHHAQFDYDFLAHEFARARMWLPVSQRLCTLALSRQVDPPTEDMKLGTLAAHYGVQQQRAHDALDDTRVLAGVLRASLREATRLDLPLPLVSCPPRAESPFTPKPPKTPCAYRNPGRLAPGGPLRQGMKIAITGETAHARAELVGRAVAAGLNVMTSVSRHTSVLITDDPAAPSAKARRAVAEGVPVIDEQTFLRLLADVRPGTPHEATAVRIATATEPEAEQAARSMTSTSGASSAAPTLEAADSSTASPGVSVPAPRRSEPSAGTSDKPLTGRRVLVLGGVHADAAAARTRVVELGASAAINLSAGVTDVVLLPGGEDDRRMARVTALELPVHDLRWLASPTVTDRKASAFRLREPHVIPRGGVIDLPMPHGGPAPEWHVTACWVPRTGCEIDVVAFLLDEDEQVTCDEDFVFY